MPLPVSQILLSLVICSSMETMAIAQTTPDQIEKVEWVVEDIDGGGVIDASRVTLAFSDDGRLTGRASCNSYSASWSIQNGRLSIGHAMTGRKACAEALMVQERRFLSILSRLVFCSLTPEGALVLQTEDGRSLKAFPSG